MQISQMQAAGLRWSGTCRLLQHNLAPESLPSPGGCPELMAKEPNLCTGVQACSSPEGPMSCHSPCDTGELSSQEVSALWPLEMDKLRAQNSVCGVSILLQVPRNLCLLRHSSLSPSQMLSIPMTGSESPFEFKTAVCVRPPSLQHQLQVGRVPQTTFRFNNVLEVLTELVEGCYAHSYSLLHEKSTN